MKRNLLIVFFALIGWETVAQIPISQSTYQIKKVEKLLNGKDAILYIEGRYADDTTQTCPVLWTFYRKKKVNAGISLAKGASFFITDRTLKQLRVEGIGYLPVSIPLKKQYWGQSVSITVYLAPDPKPLHDDF